MRPVGHDDVVLDGRPRGGHLLGERHKRQVEEQHLVLGVVDNVGELVGEEPRVDGVAHGADAGDRVIGLEVAMVVPGDRRHPVAEPDTETHQRLRELLGARLGIGIGKAMERAFRRARDDLGIGVIARRVADQRLDQQRPIHHQPTHREPPFARDFPSLVIFRRS